MMTTKHLSIIPGPERTRQILDLAISNRDLRHYAYLPDENPTDLIFADLAGNWVVHAELGLDYSVNVKAQDLPAAFQRYGMRCKPEQDDDAVLVYAGHQKLRIRALADGRTQMRVLSCNCSDLHTLSLTPDSLALLVHFVDKAIPQVMERVEEMRMAIKRDRIAEEIAIRGLSLALHQMGVSHFLSYKHGNIEACIGLEAKGLLLRFTVPLEDAQEMTGKIRDLVAAANAIGNEYWATGMSIHKYYDN